MYKIKPCYLLFGFFITLQDQESLHIFTAHGTFLVILISEILCTFHTKTDMFTGQDYSI